MTDFDVIVIGAGLAGLLHALRLRAERPEARLLLVEAQAWPGDDVRTQRSNGFFCELGPFAFSRDELQPFVELLGSPPRVVPCLEAARTGWLFDGEQRRPLRVEPEPCSFATGCEDLVQACRRQLDGTLRLGRAVTRLQPADGGGFAVTLGGEAPTELRTAELVLATSPSDAAQLLGAFDPELPSVGEQVAFQQRAFVWLGCLSKDAPELHGYGVLPHPALKSTLAELIFCTDVFPNRAMADRCLVRAELLGGRDDDAASDLPADDAAIVAQATEELRRWTDASATFGFTKVHRFATPIPDGALTECRTRLTDLTTRIPNLTQAPRT